MVTAYAQEQPGVAENPRLQGSALVVIPQLKKIIVTLCLPIKTIHTQRQIDSTRRYISIESASKQQPEGKYTYKQFDIVNVDCSSRDWQVVKVCSSLQNAQDKVTELIVAHFLRQDQSRYYESPFQIQTWNLDGERVDDPEDWSDQVTLQQVCRLHPEVDEELNGRKKAEERQRLMDEHQAQQQKLAARQELDKKLLKSQITPDEYRAQVDTL